MYTRILCGILLFGVVYGAPNHIKTVYLDKEVQGGASVGQAGASASWGPFAASAGVGGANFGGAGAGAGIGSGSSSSAAASASVGASGSGGGSFGGPGFFDSIFNIPISVLKSVNTHLNNKDTQQALLVRRAQKQCRRHGNCDALKELMQGKVGFSGTGSVASADASSSSSVLARSGLNSANSEAAAGSVSVDGSVHKNYDSTFAIPIAALTSVNQFLNGKGK
ncbi:glycine-rich protein 1-like isoform X1 [Cimex lectularius]|uniref:Uncharacterized protein n=1 Tax=Cimex lectularius TaxID=79782 RepID=A0A8I6S2P3_CIMLE|nr:glycine-rich protein 1-like isoform X1 [Cimex lectularius]